MTKQEAVESFVERDFNSVPQEWVRKIAESEGDYPNLPMWGTMWIVDRYLGETFLKNSRVLVDDKDTIDLDQIEQEEGKKKRKEVANAIAEENWSVIEEYVNEELPYEHNILDKDGNLTSAYIYEIGDEYVVGVHGAGWDFYNGVWDRLYDTVGLRWHND